MKYDFKTIIDRAGKDALAVDMIGKIPGFAPEKAKDGFSEIPMWVADMSFATAPSVIEAMKQRLEMPLFGYFTKREEYFEAIKRWQKERNGVEGIEDWNIGYENGVLGGVVSALTSYAAPGDSVLVHSPTYIGFTNTLKANGYNIVHSPLSRDGQGVWRMDFEDMDAKIRANNIHVVIFCSPHNPTGRVWERWELEKANEVFAANDCIVICDEIWSDLILQGAKHIPYQSINEDAKNRTAAFYAPSKTFNLAGLVGSYHIIYNKALSDRVCSKSMKSHYNDMNVLSMYALMGAYSDEGMEWVDELVSVLDTNAKYACSYIENNFDGVTAARPEGTYMLFVDCTEWCRDYGKDLDWVLNACWDKGVAVQDGRMFNGPCHIRMNLALPTSLLIEAFDRMDKYIFNA